jgi:hypothetical protein
MLYLHRGEWDERAVEEPLVPCPGMRVLGQQRQVVVLVTAAWLRSTPCRVRWWTETAPPLAVVHPLRPLLLVS